MSESDVLCYRIPNWDRFQHYRDRRPLWIKLYITVSDDHDWLLLDDVLKVQLLSFWVLAAKNDNQIPTTPAYLARHNFSKRKMNPQALIDAGFLEISQTSTDPASNMLQTRELAGPEQDPPPYKETEKETEKEPVPVPVPDGVETIGDILKRLGDAA